MRRKYEESLASCGAFVYKVGFSFTSGKISTREMIGQTLYFFLEILFFGLRGGIFLVSVYFVYDFLKILVVFFVGMFVDFDIECLGHILYYFLLFCFGVVYVPLICFVCFGQILYAFLKIIVFRRFLKEAERRFMEQMRFISISYAVAPAA